MEVVKAVVFKYNADVKFLLETFNRMVNECIQRALKDDIGSPMKLERLLYCDFKRRYGLATHYCISACRVACSIIRSWKRLVRKRRADPSNPPVFRGLAMKLQKELMRLKTDRIVVTTKPYCYIEIPLVVGSYQRQFIERLAKGELRAGEITLLENKAIIIFKKEVEERQPKSYSSIDINLMSLDVLKAHGGLLSYESIDLRRLYSIRVHYFKKRRRIQKLSKTKPITSRRLMEKYSGREERRVGDMLHKITTKLVGEMVAEEKAPILENLKDLNYNCTRDRHLKHKNRKTASLPYRKIQSFIEYKMAWHGYKVHYVNARNTSKTCPRCGCISKNREQVFVCEHCGYKANRHFVACVNILRMWGQGFAPKALDELVEREGLCTST
jgi:putative transposase